MSKFGDLLKDTLKTSVVSGVAGALRKAELASTSSIVDAEGNYLGVKENNFNVSDENNSMFDQLAKQETYSSTTNSGYDFNTASSKDTRLYLTYDEEDIYKLSLPRWGYDDFINERNVFIKRLSNGLDEPNWFYFKVFFNFDTRNGLFGGIMNINDPSNGESPDGFIKGNNSALRYLHYLYNSKTLYTNDQIFDKAVALQYFTRLLSYISSNSPWFFKGVKGLDTASHVPEKFDEERFIELDLSTESVDMRLSTLLSLYKYICFDDMQSKETLPSNLRKFDMCILVFSSPIKIYHTPIKSGKTNTVYRSRYKYIYSNYEDGYRRSPSGSNMMSFKLYKFMNCEISKESLGAYMPNSLSNESAFQLGQQSLKIKYDRVYEYLNNEFMGLMFGSDGLYIDSTTLSVNPNGSDTDYLVTASEEFINNHISSLLGPKNQSFALGNIFHQDRGLYQTNIGDGFEQTRQVSNINEYAGRKFGTPYKTTSSIFSSLKKLAFNSAYKALGIDYKAQGDLPDHTVPILNDTGQFVSGDNMYRLSIDGSNKILSGWAGLQSSGSLFDNNLGPNNKPNKFLDAVSKVQNFDLGSFLNKKVTSKIKPPKFLR